MSRKRVSEAIWIESKGYWQVKVQKDGIRKAFTSSVKGRKGKHIAEGKADTWLEEGTTDMRMDRAWQLYLDSKIGSDPKHPTATYKTALSVGNIHILPILGTRKLSNITPAMWQSVLDRAGRKHLSRVTICNIRGYINNFLKYARQSRWDINRVEDGDLTIPKDAPLSKPRRAIPVSVIRSLFDDPTVKLQGTRRVPMYAYALQFAVVTGLRRGEIAGIRREDIVGTTLTICRSINSRREITPGKNVNARRSIELSQIAMDILAMQRNFLRQKDIVSAWVFPDMYGESANPLTMYRQWKQWLSEHDCNYTFHEIRHTFISLNKRDLPLDLMKAVVGHSQSMDTLGIYAHELEGDRHKAAMIVEGVFESILKG